MNTQPKTPTWLPLLGPTVAVLLAIVAGVWGKIASMDRAHQELRVTVETRLARIETKLDWLIARAPIAKSAPVSHSPSRCPSSACPLHLAGR
jgi:hypothetical protein